jgi:hypothetical protein
MKDLRKRLLAAALCLVLAAGSAQVLNVTASAAELVDLNDPSVFLKQTPSTCTLYSVLMMFRRAAILNGSTRWDSFTESNYRGAWWVSGVGIKNSLSGEGMRAEKTTLDSAEWRASSTQERKRAFIELLEAHPEGIAIWLAQGSWHAVLLTDYDSATDTFYCADPAPYAPEGRIPLTESILALPEYVGLLTGKRDNTQEDVLTHITAYWAIEEGVAVAARYEVQRSAQSLTVDGVYRDVEKYNIDGSNYFMLRDLALLLNGTGSSFAVGWDAATQTVSITTGAPYEPNGSELTVGADLSHTAALSRQTIMIDGAVRSDLTVFNIGGHNFFRLRELGEALGFSVDYDAASNTAAVVSR